MRKGEFVYEGPEEVKQAPRSIRVPAGAQFHVNVDEGNEHSYEWGTGPATVTVRFDRA